jgi:hypothetical protein
MESYKNFFTPVDKIEIVWQTLFMPKIAQRKKNGSLTPSGFAAAIPFAAHCFQGYPGP